MKHILIILSLSMAFVASAAEPDVIFVNGKIITMDKTGLVVSAVAVSEVKPMTVFLALI